MNNDRQQNESFEVVQARHVRQCTKEAKLAVVIWGLGLGYCVPVVIVMGYMPPELRPDVPPLVWGMPAWVFWGVFVPWVAQILMTWCFALFILKDDEPYMEPPGPDQRGLDQTDLTSKSEDGRSNMHDCVP